MKKVVLFTLLGLMVCAGANAQLRFGIKGGVNLANIDIADIPSVNLSENSTGFFVGPMVEFLVPGIGLGVDGAVMYSQRGKGDIKQCGFEVPVNAKYVLGVLPGLHFFLAAGPDFFINFKDIDNSSLKTLYEAEKFQVGLNLGGGVRLLKRIQIGVNYVIPLGNSITLKDAVEALGASDSYKYKTWQISAAYLF